jgi:predicted enzyme related to lactoylglutathione lyase
VARPVHFEIPIDDPDRAEAFYANVFGWNINRFDGAPQYYGLADTGGSLPGINGGLYERGPGSGITLNMGVESVDTAVESVLAHGGKLVTQKSPIPGMGWFAMCLDSEGNTIGVFEEDTTAAM